MFDTPPWEVWGRGGGDVACRWKKGRKEMKGSATVCWGTLSWTGDAAHQN